MALKIHEYPIESFTFADDDFYDIDYFDGVNYETRKIKGSAIKAGIQLGLFPNPTGNPTDYLNGLGVPTPFPFIPEITEFIDNNIVSTASLLVYVPHFGFVPDAGTYLVLVNFEARNSSPNQTVYAAIFKDNVNQIERRNFHANINQLQNASLQKVITFDGVESISLRIAMSGGTTTTEGKSIILIKTA